MELKKSREADLERKVWVFRSLGLIMIASVVLMAFTYTVADADEKIVVAEDNSMQDELVFEIEVPEEEPEPEPEQAPPPPVIEEIEVVEDDEDIEDIDLTAIEDEPEDVPVEDDEPVIAEEPIADFAEVEPAFPGGEGAMMEWLQKILNTHKSR